MAAAESCCIPAGEKRRRIDSSSEVANPIPSAITKLGDDLLVEILIRLPNPKSACRCKLVSKRWRSLLSTPYFSTRFAFAAAPAGDLITSHGRPKPILSFLPPLPADIRRRFRVWDCFKDLLLCGFSDKIRDNFGSYTYVVCNPFTKQWLALPLAPQKWVSGICVTRLVCNADKEHHRFRVVRIYTVILEGPTTKTVIDVFCSESGKWRKEACVLKHDIRPRPNNVVSCNGKLFWWCGSTPTPSLVQFDPFHLDAPPTVLAHPASLLLEKPITKLSNISVSQGAMYVIVLFKISSVVKALRFWRWGEDGHSKEEESPNNNIVYLETSQCEDLQGCSECLALVMHPRNPKIAFIEFRNHEGKGSKVFYCDLRTGELKLFGSMKKPVSGLRVFQPRVVDWLPTPIPRYEKLRRKHNGYFASLV